MLNYPLDHQAGLTFAALADPSRRGIVARLARSSATVSELAELSHMSLPAVMQHLRLLEDSGLVKSEKKGRVRTCRIEPKALTAAEQWIAEQRSIWEARLDRFENYLNELMEKEHDDD